MLCSKACDGNDGILDHEGLVVVNYTFNHRHGKKEETMYNGDERGIASKIPKEFSYLTRCETNLQAHKIAHNNQANITSPC